MKSIFKRIISCLVIFACLLVSVGVKQVVSAETEEITYTFSSYTAGTQYAENEVHVLDDRITVTTTDCHFTSEIRVYSSATNNGFVIIQNTSVNQKISGFTFNCGNKADTMDVYVSNDAETWELDQSFKVTSTSYNNYTISFTNDYKYFKLDVKGTNQVRIKSMKVLFETNEDVSSIESFQTLNTLASLNLNWSSEEVILENSETWRLITDVSDLAAGDQIIIAANKSDFALSTTQNNNNRGKASITKTDDVVELGAGVQILTLVAGKKENTFGFNAGNGYLYAASSGSNYLRTESSLSDNSSWKISITDAGVATIVAQGSYTRNTMQYNPSSFIFACYSSASQSPLSIYKLYVEEGVETHYSITEGSVALRFGTLIPDAIYEDLTSQGYSFGVNFVSGANDKDFECSNIEKVKIDEQYYYQFAVVINNMPSSAYNEKFTATCYAKLNNEKFTMNDKTHSVISILEAYVEMAKTSNEHYGSLDKKMMAGLLDAANIN